MIPNTCKQVTIFEGPDGGGKSTLAQRFAAETKARYVHFHNLPDVGEDLPRFYVEAMLPALLGYQDVVLDRCWLSEKPYGDAYRSGNLRFGQATSRMLDRLAMRCGAAVVLCLPDLTTCLKHFNSRRGVEMLDDEAQLTRVYHTYSEETLTHLPIYVHNYQLEQNPLWESALLKRIRTPPHPVHVHTAGNLDARVVLVGEAFGNHKACDPLYQWPFASFSGQGCARWLTETLEFADIREDELMWMNADQLNKHTTFGLEQSVIALGSEAGKALSRYDHDHLLVEHPQFWKRFRAADPYRLIGIIKELL